MYSKVSSDKGYINELGIHIGGASYFLCDGDEDSDIEDLPVNGVGIGSRALVIPTGHVYILGPSRVWKQYPGVSMIR